MCIRDRWGPDEALTLNDWLHNYDPTGDFVCGNHAEATFLAVSYTHLRAHETVLDLVCRLLLEKKKRQNHILT